MPDGGTETLLGGHAVLCVGYNEASQRFIVRNSWGTSWAIKGYNTFPYAYQIDGICVMTLDGEGGGVVK